MIATVAAFFTGIVKLIAAGVTGLAGLVSGLFV